MGPLHDLLLRACPPDDRGRRSIPILARALKMSSYGVFKWIHGNRIPGNKAVMVANLSEGRVEVEEFLPYVLR